MGPKAESINIEYIQKADDKRGGYVVNFCRTVLSARSGSTVWKEVRFLNNKFEKWPGRWSIDRIDEFMRIVTVLVEGNIKLLADGGRINLRPQAGKDLRSYLMRDINALAAKGEV